jgi:signal transduction histidine kinase
MKPHSVNYYVLAITLLGLLSLTLIGLNMAHEIRKVEETFTQSHTENAANELQRAVNTTLSNTDDLLHKLASWDETSQQLSDPTYYTYWRLNRVHNVQSIPDYVKAIELYKASGDALLKPRDNLLPDKLPEIPTFTRVEGDRPWLCMFKPIYLRDQSDKVFGYVGIKIDFFAALLALNRFSHIDSGSMRFLNDTAGSPRVLPVDMAKHIKLEELHKGELDQLKNIIYVTFSYIVGLVLLILIVLSWIVLVLFAKPLTRLDQYVKSFETETTTRSLPEHGEHYSVNEINNLARSLHDYQLRLDITQGNLQKLNSELEERVKARTKELQVINNELEAFSYSVSHDLRAPLRSIDGFSQAILDDYGDRLDDMGKDYLRRVRASAQRMAALIDDLLKLSRITRVEFNKSLVNLSELARAKLAQLQEQNPRRVVHMTIGRDIYAEGDEQLLAILMDNLLANAWKYSSKATETMIEFNCRETSNERVYYVKDKGAGFDSKHATKIFEVFHRLHGDEFEGTGIGLATVKRIIDRHHGRIWAESEPGKGATFFFTLGTPTG